MHALIKDFSFGIIEMIFQGLANPTVVSTQIAILCVKCCGRVGRAGSFLCLLRYLLATPVKEEIGGNLDFNRS